MTSNIDCSVKKQADFLLLQKSRLVKGTKVIAGRAEDASPPSSKRFKRKMLWRRTESAFFALEQLQAFFPHGGRKSPAQGKIGQYEQQRSKNEA
jgi:hypothetical protein